uniref:YopX protein n=1 Tax=Myoviridae sp. ctnzH2 TaxID=2827707 RepID=A0A8S5S8L4_9CAUD|nr:MAG TPA: YopX protein [Myoviridae sp. ctnzH2]
MESRYLYRGKRIDNGEWVEGYLSYPFCTEKGNESYYFYAKDSLGFFCRCVVDASTICQCTGRTDRDKALIFEHDVVAYLDTYSTENGYAEADCVGEVVWDEETLSFQVTNRLSAESWEVIDGECKVLGNTIDNSELLEV